MGQRFAYEADGISAHELKDSTVLLGDFRYRLVYPHRRKSSQSDIVCRELNLKVVGQSRFMKDGSQACQVSRDIQKRAHTPGSSARCAALV